MVCFLDNGLWRCGGVLEKTLKADMTGINIAKLEKIVFSKILDCGEK